MKRLVLSIVVLTPFFLTLSSCNNEPPTFCDSEGWSTVSVTFKAEVSAHYTDGTPVDGKEVRVVIHKLPRGEPAKGFMEFIYPLNSSGYYQTGTATYWINNPQDRIVATLYMNDGYENFEVYREVIGQDFEHANGDTSIFSFVLDDMPL